MEQQLQDIDSGTPKKRPTFLSVLCILSYIGIGFSIIGSVFGYFAMQTFSGMAENMDEESAAMFESEKMQQALAMMPYMGQLTIVAVVCGIINLVGVIMMWRLKKTGYYIYLLGAALGILLPVVIAGDVLMQQGGGYYVGLTITVAFIIMYGLNLKHMK